MGGTDRVLIVHECYEAIHEGFEELEPGYHAQRSSSNLCMNPRSDKFAAAVLMQPEVFTAAIMETGLDICSLRRYFRNRSYASVAIRTRELFRPPFIAEDADFMIAIYDREGNGDPHQLDPYCCPEDFHVSCVVKTPGIRLSKSKTHANFKSYLWPRRLFSVVGEKPAPGVCCGRGDQRGRPGLLPGDTIRPAWRQRYESPGSPRPLVWPSGQDNRGGSAPEGLLPLGEAVVQIALVSQKRPRTRELRPSRSYSIEEGRHASRDLRPGFIRQTGCRSLYIVQLKALRDYAARNGHTIFREFVDQAESGRTSERPAFREMVSMARRKPKVLDAILVWKYWRFAQPRRFHRLQEHAAEERGASHFHIGALRRLPDWQAAGSHD